MALQVEALAQRTDVMAEMQRPGGAIAAQADGLLGKVEIGRWHGRTPFKR
ncbi:hypothetical protein EDWATA_02768 [Edwardsiella tarda ATCC 23685]|uniref:Uncharacterized protein n=1 Tax=Edwardsiella tarda ATCC 23685 TaxID=500638 RepID=D4F7N2_EDWTA|nr:hypothetical protein EDWATA_02768 [Edwardsiella tarda ATCC 23685]